MIVSALFVISAPLSTTRPSPGIAARASLLGDTSVPHPAWAGEGETGTGYFRARGGHSENRLRVRCSLVTDQPSAFDPAKPEPAPEYLFDQSLPIHTSC